MQLHTDLQPPGYLVSDHAKSEWGNASVAPWKNNGLG
jgi:hypothetical protein